MSAPKREVLLSPEARVDFTDVDLDSLRRWGVAQRDRSITRLERANAGLADYPESGARRNGIFPGCPVIAVARHVVYDRSTDDAIDVARILQERADPARHLRP